jgi:hypothetical protein
VVRKEKNERIGGGVAIFIYNKLKYSHKDVYVMVIAKLKCVQLNYIGQDKILIVSCYRLPLIKIELRLGKKFFAQFESKYLTGRDFNGHHHSWGNLKNCTTNNNVVHCITKLETNIALLNDCSQTYIPDTTGSKAALNLTFVDQRSALLYIWKAGTDPWNSDHFPIYIEHNDTIGRTKCS